MISTFVFFPNVLIITGPLFKSVWISGQFPAKRRSHCKRHTVSATEVFRHSTLVLNKEVVGLGTKRFDYD